MKNRINTIRCWLFGHKFIHWAKKGEWYNLQPIFENYCIRCGIEREEIKNGK